MNLNEIEKLRNLTKAARQRAESNYFVYGQRVSELRSEIDAWQRMTKDGVQDIEGPFARSSAMVAWRAWVDHKLSEALNALGQAVKDSSEAFDALAIAVQRDEAVKDLCRAEKQIHHRLATKEREEQLIALALLRAGDHE